MISLKALFVPALLTLAACAQPEPVPEPIAPEPVYDKWGNGVSAGGCTGGQTGGAGANCIPVPTGERVPTGEGGFTQPDQDGGGGGGDAGDGSGDG